jgi:hypothetical protein
MNAWMIGLSYAGGAVACSAWAREWARRKGLNARAWGVAGWAAGPFAIAAVGLARPHAALCPHCLQPMRFEQRWCPTCRAQDTFVPDLPGREAAPAGADLDYDGLEPAAA